VLILLRRKGPFDLEIPFGDVATWGSVWAWILKNSGTVSFE